LPNLDFYAIGSDFDPLLEYVFKRSGCRIFELGSEFDAELREFETIEALTRAYALGKCKGSAHSVHLMLVPPGAEDHFKIERIELLPSTGHNYRYLIRGWGLIQLYLGGVNSAGLVSSWPAPGSVDTHLS